MNGSLSRRLHGGAGSPVCPLPLLGTLGAPAAPRFASPDDAREPGKTSSNARAKPLLPATRPNGSLSLRLHGGAGSPVCPLPLSGTLGAPAAPRFASPDDAREPGKTSSDARAKPLLPATRLGGSLALRLHGGAGSPVCPLPLPSGTLGAPAAPRFASADQARAPGKI